MKVFAALALGLFGISCGGGSSTNPAAIPQDQACAQASQAACAKIFSCPAGSDFIIAFIQGSLGMTEAGCRTQIQQMYCGAFQCGAGQTYHGDKAAACKAGFGAVTCQALSAAATAAAAGGGISGFLGSLPGCNQICTAGGADGSTGG